MSSGGQQGGPAPGFEHCVVVGSDGLVVDAGEHAAHAFGTSAGAMRERRFADLFRADDRDALGRLPTAESTTLVGRLDSDAIEGAGPAERAVALTRLDAPNSANSSNDRCSYFVTDVSELNARATDGDRLFEVTHDLVATAGLDGYFTRVSPSFVEILGWSEDELFSRSFLEFIHPDDVGPTLAELDAMAGGGATRLFTNRYRKTDGGWVWLQWTSRTDDETGKIYAIARDVSESRLLQEQLRRARDAADGANRAKSSFLASMSHELRTPLNAVIGYSEMLIEDLDDPTAQQDLRSIHDAGQQLLSLINAVLDLSKIEAGQIEVFFEPVRIEELVEAVSATVMPMAQRHENEFLVDCSAAGILETDRRKLQQLLLNLLSNAAKFTRKGRIEFSLHDRGSEVRITVRDTGTGMTRDELDQVFVPYTQSPNATGGHFDGTGLGLPIASRFARMIGATLDVRSNPNQGTTFFLDVPRTRRRESGALEVTGGYMVILEDG